MQSNFDHWIEPFNSAGKSSKWLYSTFRLSTLDFPFHDDKVIKLSNYVPSLSFAETGHKCINLAAGQSSITAYVAL